MPIASSPDRCSQRYDSYDLAPRLSIGTNVIAVLVTYYGRPMSFWQPAPAGSNTDAALVFEAQIGNRTLAGDDSWRVKRSSAWSLLSGTDAGEGVPVEIIHGKSRTDGRKSTLTTPTGSTHLCFRPSTRALHHFSVDFGRIVAGFVELDLEAPAGAVVEMHYREKLFRPELVWKGEDPETGARYVAAGADDRFAGLEINGLRYLHLVVAGISHSEQARGTRVLVPANPVGRTSEATIGIWMLYTAPGFGPFSSTHSTPTPTAQHESSGLGWATPSSIRWSTWRRTKTGVWHATTWS